jgi:hypothetical protein
MALDLSSNGRTLRVDTSIQDSTGVEREVQIDEILEIARNGIEKVEKSGKPSAEQAIRTRATLIKTMGLAGLRNSAAVPKYVPPEIDILHNIEEAKQMTALQFIQAVATGGKWDFKQGGRHREYEDFGNWHFGIVTKAWATSHFGLGSNERTENELLRNLVERGAGAYQIWSGTSKPEWSWPGGVYPHGDDPNDQENLINGWETETLRENTANVDTGTPLDLHEIWTHSF